MQPPTAGILDTIAAYARALDAGRTDEIVDLFCDDGTSHIVGIATYRGRDDLRAGYAAMVPSSSQLHLTGNTAVTSTGTGEATATSDLAFFRRTDLGWSLELVGRYDDTLVRQGGRWRFRARVLTLQQ